MTDSQTIIGSLRSEAQQLLPKGSSLYLYGSRARGTASEQSDWDFLLLLDKPRVEFDDFDRYAYPLIEHGWSLGQDFSIHTYARHDWQHGLHSPFYYNVEQDKQVVL